MSVGRTERSHCFLTDPRGTSGTRCEPQVSEKGCGRLVAQEGDHNGVPVEPFTPSPT